MRTIFKYALDVTDKQNVAMPAHAELLHIDNQNGVLSLWAMVDTDQPTTSRLIGIVGTGNPAPEPWSATYVGSALCPPFVWHVFDGGEV